MFLANENFPKPGTQKLRAAGFAVKSIQEDSPGIADREVIKMASELNSILLTFDSDYGELIFKYAHQNPPAIIFFREKGNHPELAVSALCALLEAQNLTFSNAFTVIETNNVRHRFYK